MKMLNIIKMCNDNLGRVTHIHLKDGRTHTGTLFAVTDTDVFYIRDCELYGESLHAVTAVTIL